MKPGGDRRQLSGGIVKLVAQDVAGDGGVVVDDEAAFAIEQTAARGEDGDLADAVGFSEDAVAFCADDLQTIEAGDENAEDGDHDVLAGVQLARRDLLFPALGATAARTEGRTRGCGDGLGGLPRVGDRRGAHGEWA